MNTESFKKIIENAKIEKSTTLDLINIDEEFDSIPLELFDLVELEELRIGRRFNIKSVPNEILKLKKLKKIVISGEFEEFPMLLLKLNGLTHLTLDSTTLKIIPNNVKDWKKLSYLNLGNCTKLETIEGLPPNLTYIYLNGAALKQIPDALYSLYKLDKLVLSDFDLQVLDKRILNLKKISSLFIGDCNLMSLPNEMDKLVRLEELWLDGNEFETIPESILKLSNLKQLVLNRNLLDKVPNGILSLVDLNYLDLGSNNFQIFPREVLTLKSLKDLKLGNYTHSEVKHENSFTEVPVEIMELKKLRRLDLFRLKIDNIPSEIIKEGVEAIKNYFNSKLEADKEEFLYEAKMVIVGRGDVGKSVLTKKLTVPHYSLSKSETTKGIDILKNPWSFEMEGLQNATNFQFNIWDFGGQEKYDATHQLFITNRSLYLFLTEARAESNYQDVFYWLNTISLLSYNSPIIVILSKYDERKKVLPESIYKEQFHNIVDFVDVSCADGFDSTIDNLKRAIANAVTLLPQTKLTLSNHWVNVRKRLEELSQEYDYIDYSEYLKICKENKLDEVRGDFLSEYLNDLGVIIYHKNDLLLKKTIFINTDWCVDGMYKVLDDELVFKNKGKFTNSDLEKIWEESRFSNKQPELIRLMQDYGLCFEVSDKSAYIAPDLLVPDRPKELSWNNDENLLFEYHYTFMPTGMISRFIVKAHNFIKDELYWKYGVVLIYDDTEALVQEDYINSKIKVSLKGSNKKGLLSAIKMFIDDVHKDFDKDNKLVFEQMVPCNCESCLNIQEPHFYKFNVLKKFEQKTILEIHCEKSSEPVRIKRLINDVELQSVGDQIETSTDLQGFIIDLIDEVLEKEIRLKQGNLNFWRDKKCSLPKDEVEIQPYICNSLDNLCKIKGINLSREVKEGNGNVDVIFSYTNKNEELLKVCVEIKKAHHQDVETAINSQLPIYMDSAGTNAGIYIVIWFKGNEFDEPLKYSSDNELLSIIESNNPDTKNIIVKILNCSKQTSPSKLRIK